MDCKRAQQFWHDRFDEGLPVEAQNGLAAHLAACEPCRRYHAEMERLASGLDRLRILSDRAVPWRDKSRPAGGGRRRVWWRAGGLARIAAAVALFVTGSAYVSRELARQAVPGPGNEFGTQARVPEDSEDRTSLTLTGESAELYLAVARPSSDPRVHVFWLYDVYPTNER